ncbi:F-actin-monooxygenase MICAL3-like isoform X2 [Heptranchias perlo]|uniref:F-actin-monooxygenase MICAL3-like isoform X2 n=1 Tax=Heptranchias perlo TaxID=212740 RepID=UPI00355A5A94
MTSYTLELEQLVREKEEACGESKPSRQVVSVSSVDPQPSSVSTRRGQPEHVDDLRSPGAPSDFERRAAQSRESTSPLSDRSPVRSQPMSFSETPSPRSPVESQPATSLRAQSPSSAPPAICCQPLTSPETANPIAVRSPVKSQPVSMILTSTPITDLVKLGNERPDDGMRRAPGPSQLAAKKEPIDEFWLRSMEIRKGLGVSPLGRNSGSETSFTLSTTGSASPQSFTPEEMFEEQRSHSESPPPPSTTPIMPGVKEQVFPALTSSPFIGVDPKSSDSGQRHLTSTSGLGLNGSFSNTRTAASESLNNSDTMLTPPSSPPPPPPADEEPATLRRKKYRDKRQSSADTGPTLLACYQLTSVSGTQSDNVRKSLAESLDEIPFADDVEDTYDDRTPDTSLQERFYTPPTSRPKQEKPCKLHLAQGPKAGDSQGMSPKWRALTQISPEAKEIAKERMRAREKSVKSQALRDAMEKQLRKMKEMEVGEVPPTQAQSVPRVPLAQEAPHESTIPSTFKLINGHKLQQESVVDRLVGPTPAPAPAPAQDLSYEGSGASSEGSAGKSKKRSSLFSPRKNKKEKKSKTDSRLLDKSSSRAEDLTKPKSIWKSVFSSYRKDRKKKEEKICPSTPSSTTDIDTKHTKHTTAFHRTAVELQLRQHLSLSEDSDLSSDDILERTSQRSRREKPYTEEELNSKLTRRVQKAARRQAKQEELKRLHRAQIIQRQLEQVEEKQRQLEERGVAVEKALRGEAGMGKKDDPRLMQEWFRLVQEKNSLVRYESELMIFARELELEDRQSRLQQELRERMAIEDNLKSSEELSDEKRILNEMLEVVEQRDALVALLEEQRLREKEEDKDLEAVMLSKSYNLNWS